MRSHHFVPVPEREDEDKRGEMDQDVFIKSNHPTRMEGREKSY